MKKSALKSCCAILLLLCLSACAKDNGSYAAISTRQISPYALTKSNITTARKVTATDSRHVLIVLPSDRQPSINDPINELLNKYHGDYLTNASVQHKSLDLMWLYHYDSWEVTADVVRIRH